MSGERRVWTDERIEQVMGIVLRVGVLLAAALVVVGGAVYLSRYGTGAPRYGAFHGEPGDLRSVAGVVRDAAALRGRGLIQLGLLLLIATPIARVAFSLVAFAFQRDRLYVVVTAIVLGLLVVSLVGWGG
jgi:uncharacterized membrane protein